MSDALKGEGEMQGNMKPSTANGRDIWNWFQVRFTELSRPGAGDAYYEMTRLFRVWLWGIK